MLLEWYRAFAGIEAVLQDTQALVCELCGQFCGGTELVLPGGAHIDVTPPFEHLTLREAFRRFAGVADACELSLRDESAFFQTLVDAVEPGLAALGRPVFLYDFPASQAALARLKPGDPSVAERFELYVGGIELCNGYGELNDAQEQRARFERDQKLRLARGRSDPPLPSRFLAALEQGMPPAAGNALGMERLIMLLSGEPRIDRLYAFPEG
jgi:lysyl-tRNA synthetase class 2